MHIILHIGQSKTGTTAIQGSLRNNRDVLKKHGILYPDVKLKNVDLNMLNHNAFANALAGQSFHPRLSAQEYWEQFMAQSEQGDYHTILLSAESFFGGAPYLWDTEDVDEYNAKYIKKIENLALLLKGHDVTIIVYLRPQEKWLSSAIPQIIRYQGTFNQKIYQSDDQIGELLAPVMDYNNRLELWDKIIKPRAIKISEYNRSKFPEGDVILDFLDKINIPLSEVVISNLKDEAHDSWSAEFLEVKKKLDVEVRSRAEEDTIINILNKLNGTKGGGVRYSLDLALHQKIINKFLESNKKLSVQFNQGKDVFLPYDACKGKTGLSDEVVSEAMVMFTAQYNSLYGRKSYLLNLFKRALKRGSPFLFSLASSWQKTIKNLVKH